MSEIAKLNILSVITGYVPSIGGAQIHTHRLNRELTKRHHIQVVCQWTENRTDFLRGTTLLAPTRASSIIDGIPVERISPTQKDRRQMIFWVLSYYLLQGLAINRISSILSKQMMPIASDVDIVHNVRMGRESLSFASFRVARELQVPFVFSPLHHPRWGRWLHRHYQSLYLEADVIMTLTNWERQKLIKFGVDSRRIVISGIGPVISSGIDSESFLTQYGITDPFVMFLGQKYPYKGIRSLLEATELVWSQMPNVQFVFIGPRTAYSSRIFKKFPDERIIEIGVVDLATKSSALQAADVVCVPSNQESFGGVFVEAWALGSPVIGGDCPAVREVISDGKDGFIVQQNAAQIADRLIILLRDPALRLKMAGTGMEKVTSRYSWKHIAARTEEAYQLARKNFR